MNERMPTSRRALLGASLALAAAGSIMDYSSAAHFVKGMEHRSEESIDNYHGSLDQAIVQQNLAANDFAQSGDQLLPGFYAVLVGTISYVGVTISSRQSARRNPSL
jgi:hypothetical protein